MDDIVALGGRLELRTNWRCYAEEFACTIRQWYAIDAIATSWQPRCPVSAFERKYLHSDHALFRVVVELPRSVAP